MTGDAFVTGLINLGVAGVVLYWFMSQASPRLERLERAIDRLVRAQMLTILANKRASEAMRQEAGAILAEMKGPANGLDGGKV